MRTRQYVSMWNKCACAHLGVCVCVRVFFYFNFIFFLQTRMFPLQCYRCTPTRWAGTSTVRVKQFLHTCYKHMCTKTIKTDCYQFRNVYNTFSSRCCWIKRKSHCVLLSESVTYDNGTRTRSPCILVHINCINCIRIHFYRRSMFVAVRTTVKKMLNVTFGP